VAHNEFSPVTDSVYLKFSGDSIDTFEARFDDVVVRKMVAGEPVAILDVSSDTTIAVVVDPSLTFIVSGHSGTCNWAAQSAGSSVSGASVGLGRINSANGVGAQDLAVTTNAASGFSVYARSAGLPTAASGATLANVGGTNPSPITFPSFGTEAFGYTTSDATLGTGTPARFTSGGAKWAAMTTSNAEISYGTGPVTADTVCVAYQAGVSGVTRAGSYATTVTYTAVPIF